MLGTRLSKSEPPDMFPSLSACRFFCGGLTAFFRRRRPDQVVLVRPQTPGDAARTTSTPAPPATHWTAPGRGTPTTARRGSAAPGKAHETIGLLPRRK